MKIVANYWFLAAKFFFSAHVLRTL